MLPDDVLLEIFNFYLDEDLDEDFEPHEKQRIEEWITLVHVCRLWRSVVFRSPRRLNLRLLCTPETRARDTLDIWPPLPLIIQELNDFFFDDTPSEDNIIAALEHNDRVCQIDLSCLTRSKLEYVTDSAAMHKPIPELTDLHLSGFRRDSILPDSFLGGTTPRLRLLIFWGIPFPGLPKLLLSATHLVYLSLHDIPRSGYIPPEAMATSISALTNLEYLRLDFQCPRPRPALGSRHPPPLTRSILPSLTGICFKGTSEYLEEILARSDAPRLNELDITFFNQVIFDTPQLFQFISRRPTLRAPEKGHISFNSQGVIVKFPSQTSGCDVLSVRIPCTASEWQLSSLEQLCTSSLPPVFTLQDLYIFENRRYPPDWQDDVENTLWLDLLRSFVAVKNLYLSEEFGPRIAPALQSLVGGRTTEVLLTLENIFLEGSRPSGPLHEGIERFVAARRLTSHPVAISRWDRDRDREVYDW
jgi:F-box-like